MKFTLNFYIYERCQRIYNSRQYDKFKNIMKSVAMKS